MVISQIRIEKINQTQHNNGVERDAKNVGGAEAANSGGAPLTPDVRFQSLIMDIAAALLGIFILFALVFNGGIGSNIFNIFGTVSGLALISFIVPTVFHKKTNLKFSLAILAGIAYLPLVYNRFSGPYGVDWGGFVCDILIVGFIIALFFKHNYRKAPQNNIGVQEET